jgi:hypothetical protein
MSTEPERQGWAGVSIGAGLALAAVAALSLVGVLAQGFAVSERTGVAYKMAAPSLAGVPVTERQRRQVAAAFATVLVVCLVVVFGSVLGVITRLHFDEDLDAATRRVLATFVIRSMGPAVVAFGAALAIVPRLPRPVTPPPYSGDGGADADPEPEPGPGTGAP